jgi:hypothetical protein
VYGLADRLLLVWWYVLADGRRVAVDLVEIEHPGSDHRAERVALAALLVDPYLHDVPP